MYGKFFASTFTGSMYGAGAEIHAVWAFIIANANDDAGYVELNSQIVGGCIGMSPGAVEKVLTRFCSPDPKSRSKVKEGRKLMKEGEYLYQIVNYEKYRAIKNQIARRESNREAQRRRRERLRDKPLKGERKYVATANHKGIAAADEELDRSQNGCEAMQYPGGDGPAPD